MNPRRRLLSAASAVGALLALTACEQPMPLVTIVSGGQSVYTEARSWCFEEQTPPDCTERKRSTPSLPVRGGERIGVDVGEQLLEDGWYIELADPSAQGEQAQPQRSEPQTDHYFSFDAPNLPAGSELLLTVFSLGEGEEPTGEFRFQLTPAR